MGNLTTRVIRTREEIEDIRDLWMSWQSHPNSDIDFYLTVQRLRPKILRPHVIVVYNDRRPESMLVGRIEESRVECSLGYRVVFAPRMRVMSIVHGGELGNWTVDGSRAALHEIANCLRHDEADAARFNFIRADTALCSRVLRSTGFAQRDYFPVEQVHRAMKLPGTIADVYAALSGDHRWEIRKKSKKFLADHPDARIECLRDVTDLDRICVDAEEIARQTYQRGLGAGFADSVEMRAIVDLELRKGWHRTYILYTDNKPCAFWMGAVYCGTFHSSHLGYQSSYEKYSPGTFLMIRAMEEMCKESVEELDFGLGDARYKERFGNRDWNEVASYVFAPSLKSLTLNAVRTPTVAIDRAIRKVLQRTALMARIKRIWRRQLRETAGEESAKETRTRSSKTTGSSSRICAG